MSCPVWSVEQTVETVNKGIAPASRSVGREMGSDGPTEEVEEFSASISMRTELH